MPCFMIHRIEKATFGDSVSHEEAIKIYSAGYPDGRYCKPSEVADLAVYLASARSGHLIGSGIRLDGGMSLVEQIDSKGVGPQQKSIIDRCTAAIYQEARDTDTIPTLSTLREKLLQQPEPEAQQIALSMELFTTGSLDIFGHGSNVDLDKRVVVFDIHSLGTQLKPAGLLVITDTMTNFCAIMCATASGEAKLPFMTGFPIAAFFTGTVMPFFSQ